MTVTVTSEKPLHRERPGLRFFSEVTVTTVTSTTKGHLTSGNVGDSELAGTVTRLSPLSPGEDPPTGNRRARIGEPDSHDHPRCLGPPSR